MVAGVTRSTANVDGATINVVSNTGAKVSNMTFQFKLPAGATAAFAEGADTTYAEFTATTVVKVTNPGVGMLTIPMVITDSEGVSMEVTLKADFMNAISYRTTGSVAQSGNDLTFTSGNTTMYVLFEKSGVEGAYIEVENVSRNLLGRYVVSNDIALRLYNPVYDQGSLTVNLKNADGEIVKTYNVTMKFNTKAYSPIAATLRSTYEVNGDTITVTANAGATNIYLQIGKYYGEKLSTSNADTTYVQQVEAKGWKIYKSETPVEFDMTFDASSEGGDAVTRHIVVNF